MLQKRTLVQTVRRDTDPSEAAAEDIAKKIYGLLHERKYRIHESRPQKLDGRIAARAASIRNNALRPRSAAGFAASPWTDEDEHTYESAGNVAAEVAREAEEIEKNKTKDKTSQRVSVSTAAEVLYVQYGRLFTDGNGKALSIREACKQFPGLFALHMEVKDTYGRLLKNHKKKSGVRILPKDMAALFGLIASKSDNRDINALVRLGKVIHYTAAT